MTAADDGYPEVLRRVVSGFGPLVVGSDDRLEGLPAPEQPRSVVAAGLDDLDEAWARAGELRLPTVHVVVAGVAEDVRRSVRNQLAARGWTMLSLTRVMWGSGSAAEEPLSRHQRIDRDTRDVVAEVAPADAAAIPLLAEALDRAQAEVDVLLHLAGQPQQGRHRAEAPAPAAEEEAGGRGVRRLLGRRQP